MVGRRRLQFIATQGSGEGLKSSRRQHWAAESTYFRRIPRNIRSLELSSGDFSCDVAGAVTEDSEAEEAAVDGSAEPSADPDAVEDIVLCYIS